MIYLIREARGFVLAAGHLLHNSPPYFLIRRELHQYRLVVL